jgi:hypothetical protein
LREGQKDDRARAKAKVRRDSNALKKWHQTFPAALCAASSLDLRGSKFQ